MKFKAVTPWGTFERESFRQYSHVVVRESMRARDETARLRESGLPGSGVGARWLQDNGFAVSWHTTKDIAEAIGRKQYVWDTKGAYTLGVFPVTRVSHAQEQQPIFSDD